MDWTYGIQRAIDYIEENLAGEIDVDRAAARAYSSAFHFQRVFSILCGYTVGDYVRMRRLTLAGTELAKSDKKVIDVALKYGYDTPESFSRAFTRFHGIPPSAAKNGGEIKSFSRISVKLILSGGNMMNYRIVKLDEFKVICKKKRVPHPMGIAANPLDSTEPTAMISAFWGECSSDGTIERLLKYIPEDNHFPGCIVGISFTGELKSESGLSFPEKFPKDYPAGFPKEFPYGIGAHYNGAEVTDPDFTVETIPAATYAVFTCTGEMPDAFRRTYHGMYSEFFPSSEYKPCFGIEFEAYPSADVKNPDYKCEIWVAVEKKRG